MARTASKEETLPLVNESADIHHIVRTLADQDIPGGPIGPDTADAYLNTWLKQGYKLHTVVPLGTSNINGVFAAQILYIVVKD